MTHISQKCCFQSVRLFCFLLGNQQFLTGFFQVILQMIDADNIIYGYQKTSYQEHECCNHSNHPIFILLIKSGSFINQLSTFRQINRIQSKLMHPFHIKHIITGNRHNASLVTGLTVQKIICGIGYFFSHLMINRSITSQRPMPQTDRCNSKNRQRRISIAQHIRCVAHHIILRTVYAPCTHKHTNIIRQMAYSLTDLQKTTVPAIKQHQLQLGIFFHLLLYKGLHGKTTIRVIRDKCNFLHIRIKTTHQFNILVHIILIDIA